MTREHKIPNVADYLAPAIHAGHDLTAIGEALLDGVAVVGRRMTEDERIQLAAMLVVAFKDLAQPLGGTLGNIRH